MTREPPGALPTGLGLTLRSSPHSWGPAPSYLRSQHVGPRCDPGAVPSPLSCTATTSSPVARSLSAPFPQSSLLLLSRILEQNKKMERKYYLIGLQQNQLFW